MAAPAYFFYVADPSDPTLETKLLNFNGTNPGATFSTLLHDFDIGMVETDPEWLTQAGVPGAVQVTRRHPVVEMRFRLHVDDVLSDMTILKDRLNLALDSGGIIVWQESSSSTRYIIDFYPSPLTGFYRGQERSIYKILGLLQDPDGMPVRIWRHPYLRTVQLDAATNLVTNSMLLEDAANDGRPDGWAWVSETGLSLHRIAWSILGLDAAYVFEMATTSTRDLRQTVTPAASGEVWTFSFDAAGTGGAGGVVTPQAQAIIEFLTAADAVLATATGTLTTTAVAFGWTRLTVTSAAAPATTAKIRCTMRFSANVATTHARYARNAQAEKASAATTFRASATTITNDITATNGKHLFVYNPGNVSAIAQVRATPDAAGNIVRFDVARRSGSRDSAEFINQRADFRVTDVGAPNLFNGTTAGTVDAEATGGTCATTTFTDAVLRKRWRREISVTDPTAIQGIFRWFGDVKGGTASEFRVQIRYGPGDVADLPYVIEPLKPVDTGDAVTAEYEVVDYGTISLPPGAAGLFMEGWAQRISGSGTLRWDVNWPMPADEQFTSVVLPSQEDPVLTRTDDWLGSELVTPAAAAGVFAAGEVIGTHMVLRVSTTGFSQAAGTPPDTGLVFDAAVQHTVSAELTLFNPLETAFKHGELRVYDVTTSAQVAKKDIKGDVGVRWPSKTVSISFTPTAGRAYQFYVVYSATSSSGNIHVLEISDTFTPPVLGSSSQSIAMDGDTRLVYTRENGMFARPLSLEGPLIELAPGVNLIRGSLSDNGGTGHTRQKHVFDRTAAVVVNLIPRYS